MAERTISTAVEIDGAVTPDFSFDWEIEFKGEKYILPLRAPQGSKGNETILTSVELNFQHWAEYQLKRWLFCTMPEKESGTAVPDQYKASVSLNLKEFCSLFGQVLEYYFGNKITIDLNPGFAPDEEPTVITINNSYIWDVLIKLYELFAVRWQIVAAEGNSNGIKDGERYVIKVGYPATEISHIFRYGFEDGLLKVERQVQAENIRNMIIGRGGSKNLPYRYFKRHDENNANFSPDPDWIPELAIFPFTELHGATFRSYIQGWKTKHYGGASVTSASGAYAPWAWMRGYTDERFAPIEYVADEFSTEDNGYKVVAGSSIQRYGGLMGGLEANEDIYPTIQGVEIPGLGRIDEIVNAEKILTDYDGTASSLTEISNAPSCWGTIVVGAASYRNVTLQSQGTFNVRSGKRANLLLSPQILRVMKSGSYTEVETSAAEIKPGSEVVTVVNAVTGERRSASGIPEGTWTYEVQVELHNMLTDTSLFIYAGAEDVKLQESDIVLTNPDTWKIWIKNIWQSSRLPDETPVQYAERVWRPVLGDSNGNEAKVVFTTGALAASGDYEFGIVATPEYDESQMLDGVPSHWLLTLAKSDADFESLGVYVPSSKRFAVAGDHIAFTGIDMPHMYVVKAEERLDDFKKDQLDKVKDVKPAIVASLDKVRIHNHGKANALIESLKPGNTIRIADKRFILDKSGKPLAYEKYYIQSITYNYLEPTEKEANILPDVEITLSDSYKADSNPVSHLSSEIDALQKQLGSISNVAGIVTRVGDRRYLRKDMDDTAAGKITVSGGLVSERQTTLAGDTQFGKNFAEGATGFGGKIDSKGNGWLGGLHLREFLEVPELRYNRTEINIGNDWNAPGGGIIESVAPDYNADGSMKDSGTITLHLETGELGAVAVDDLCQGIYHDTMRVSDNATADADDGKGNFSFAGFCSVYFRVVEILDESNNSVFKYELRQGWHKHPSAQMHFVSYGNKTNANRQTSKYSTRTYERYLKGVNDWEFTAENVAAQFGDLSNLSIFGLRMEGYSAYLNNIYMSGTIEQFTPMRVEVESDGGLFLGSGDYVTLTAKAIRGWEDVSGSVTGWTISRDGGASWAKDAPEGKATIGYADLLTDRDASTFLLRAEGNNLDAIGSITLYRRPENGSSFTANLMVNTEERIAAIFDSAGDNIIIKRDCEVHMVEGETYTVSARTNASRFLPGAAPVGAEGCGLLLLHSVYGVTSGYWDMISGTDMSTDGTKGHTLVWNKPTGDYYLRASFYLPGEWWVEKVKIERGKTEHTQWTPAESEMVGQDGAPGIDGMIVRTTEWSAQKHYRNDSAIASGILRYLDIVILRNSKGVFESAWQCKVTHTSNDQNKPGGEGAEVYWQRLNNMQPIYTPLILAENATISFVQGNSLRIYDKSGTLQGGMQASEGNAPVIFAGPESEDPTTGQTQILPNGEAYFGSRTGANVHIIPSVDASLPRVECSDGQGNITIRMEASDISNIEDLFGGETENVSAGLPMGQTIVQANVVKPPNWVENDRGSATSSREIKIEVPAEGVIVVQPSDILLRLDGGRYYGKLPASQYAVFYIYLDGKRIAFSQQECRWFDVETGEILDPHYVNVDTAREFIGYSTYSTFSYTGGTFQVGAGTHTIKFELTASGYCENTFWGQASAESDILIRWRGQKKIARYFANGFAIGNATDNYCMGAIIDGVQVLRAANINGIRFEMDGTGIYIEKNGKRLDLTTLIK